MSVFKAGTTVYSCSQGQSLHVLTAPRFDEIIYRCCIRGQNEGEGESESDLDAHLRPTVKGSENRKQNRIYLHRAESVSSAVGSNESFLLAAYTRKTVLFAHSTSPLQRVLTSRTQVTTKLGRLYAPLKSPRCQV